MRNYHLIVLSDEEYSEVLAALGRIKDSNANTGLKFYGRLFESAPWRVKQRSNELYSTIEFSNVHST